MPLELVVDPVSPVSGLYSRKKNSNQFQEKKFRENLQTSVEFKDRIRRSTQL